MHVTYYAGLICNVVVSAAWAVDGRFEVFAVFLGFSMGLRLFLGWWVLSIWRPRFGRRICVVMDVVERFFLLCMFGIYGFFYVNVCIGFRFVFCDCVSGENVRFVCKSAIAFFRIRVVE